MKVLFICSGNSEYFGIAPFIKSQGIDVMNQGVDVDYYRIIGRGLPGYIKNIKPLRQYLKNHSFDLLHAHYSLNAVISLLTFSGKPIVVSYMGSDAYGSYSVKGKFKVSSFWIILLSLFIQPFVSFIICKSQTIKKYVYTRNSEIIPNGVNLERFIPSDERSAKPEIRKKRILFLGDRKSVRKNFLLLSKAIKHLDEKDIDVITPYPVEQEKLPELYNKADVLALCSFEEGSPNVVKEAMACNCPIVSTDVGDVKWLFGDLEGLYIANNDPVDFAEKLKIALEYGNRTKGRERIIELGLDSETVAKRIVEVYERVLETKRLRD